MVKENRLSFTTNIYSKSYLVHFMVEPYNPLSAFIKSLTSHRICYILSDHDKMGLVKIALNKFRIKT